MAARLLPAATTAAALKWAAASRMPEIAIKQRIVLHALEALNSAALPIRHGESTATTLACQALRIVMPHRSRAVPRARPPPQPVFAEADVAAVETIFQTNYPPYPGLLPVIFSLSFILPVRYVNSLLD